MKLLLGVLYGTLAQVMTFLQLQGTVKWQWLIENKWLAILAGIPISFLYMNSAHNIIEYFNGEIWPGRLIGFAIGVIIFTAMASIFFGETITAKTGVTLALSVIILLVQIFWK